MHVNPCDKIRLHCKFTAPCKRSKRRPSPATVLNLSHVSSPIAGVNWSRDLAPVEAPALDTKGNYIIEHQLQATPLWNSKLAMVIKNFHTQLDWS